jgi:hypothetical protein
MDEAFERAVRQLALHLPRPIVKVAMGEHQRGPGRTAAGGKPLDLQLSAVLRLSLWSSSQLPLVV